MTGAFGTDRNWTNGLAVSTDDAETWTLVGAGVTTPAQYAATPSATTWSPRPRRNLLREILFQPPPPPRNYPRRGRGAAATFVTEEDLRGLARQPSSGTSPRATSPTTPTRKRSRRGPLISGASRRSSAARAGARRARPSASRCPATCRLPRRRSSARSPRRSTRAKRGRRCSGTTARRAGRTLRTATSTATTNRPVSWSSAAPATGPTTATATGRSRSRSAARSRSRRTAVRRGRRCCATRTTRRTTSWPCGSSGPKRPTP